MFTVCALAGVLLCGAVVFSGCDDSSSAGEDNNETSAVESSSSVTPSDVEGSSKTAWDYLNPDINYGEFTDERDGQVYKTVKIEDQIWMAQNLNYAYTGVKFRAERNTSDSISWCYENKVSNCDKYGRLYTWAAAMDSVGEWSTSGKGCGYGDGENCSVASAGSATLVRGVCPKGWHLPSPDEWEALFTAVGGSSTAGTKLKSVTGWNAYNDITNEDAFGFSALPAGRRNGNGSYPYEGYYASFWSSTEYNRATACSMTLYYGDVDAYLSASYEYIGFSVRCLKDSD